VGKQPISYASTSIYGSGATGRVRNASQPAWVMGKAERFDKQGSTGWVPGPGQYGLRPSVGAQADSKKPSLPKFGFGSSTREDREKVFVSQEHEKVAGGRDAPGPGQYVQASLTGKPVTSGTQKSGAAWGFGTSKRFTDEFRQRAPGPGHYVI